MAVEPLRVAFVISDRATLGGRPVQAERLLHAWQADADRETCAVRPSAIAATSLPRRLRHVAAADVVHLLSTSSFPFLGETLAALSVARLVGRPVILSCGDDPGAVDFTGSAIVRHALAAVALTVVPSRVMLEALERLGVHSTLIPDLIATEEFPFRERDPLRPRLLSVRNFEPLDNVAATIRAFAIVQQRWPEAMLTLLGQGSQETMLRSLAAELGLRDVAFTAPREQTGLSAAYADHDIFVQSANVDNVPTSMLQAFASGLPAVSTAAGAVPAVLVHGVHGLLAPLADYQTLGHHVLRLLASPDYARGLARAAHARCDACRWPRIREQWLRVYAGVRSLAGRTPRGAFTHFMFGAPRFVGDNLQIGAERSDRPAARRHLS